MHYLQQCVPMLSALLVALSVDVLSRLMPVLRDHLPPLLGIPARMAVRLDKKLNRMERPRNVRATRGLVSCGIMLALGVVLGVGLQEMARLNAMIEPLVWFMLVRVTLPWGRFVKIKQQKNTDISPHIRDVLEDVAQTLTTGFLTPVVYGLVASVLKLPVLVTVVALVTLLESARVLVTPEKQDQPFVQGFRVLEEVIDFVPSRISVVFLALASIFTPKANPVQALRTAFAQGSWGMPSSRGWPKAAIAGALNVALPTYTPHHTWFGGSSATARADRTHLRAGMWLHAVTLGMLALVLIAVLFMGLAL